MKPFVIRILVLAILLSAAPLAKQQAPGASDRLPVRRVVLYKSGVGYFEHLGRIRGAQTVTIDFTSGQLDDVLKSLTALDLDGGRVAGVSYNSEAALDRRLGALRLPVGANPTRAQFLGALRGARVEVRAGTTRILGRLLGVERVARNGEGGVIQIDAVSVVTDGGDMQTIPLEAHVTVRIIESDLNQEVGRYLTLLSSARDQDLRRLAISTAGAGDRDLFVSYVSEVPVWKATYRLVLPDDSPVPGQPTAPLLQGWAIVDNTVGEDWENVELSLVAGAPQSFIQQVSRPYFVQRPIVPLPERVLMSPQTHQSAIATAGAGAIAGAVTEGGGGALPGASVRALRNGVAVSQATTGPDGRFALRNIAPGTYDVEVTLAGFRSARRTNVAVGAGMETAVNFALAVGAIGEEMSVSADMLNVQNSLQGVASNARRGGPPPPAAMPAPPPFRDTMGRVDDSRAKQQAQAAGAELGDLFEYKLKEPITIRKNQSALVPILSGAVQTEKVSLWNADAPSARALRAIWLTNSTGLTLDGGTFSVIEGSAFAGEGIVEPLKAGERRLLSYAVDLAVTVDARTEGSPARVSRVRVTRGVMTQESEERQRRTYTIRNEDAAARNVVIEHPVRPGWRLDGTIKAVETTPAVHRFRVPVAAKTTTTFTVDETRPIVSEIAVASVTSELVGLWVRDTVIDAALERALREVMARQAEIARLDREIDTRQSEMEQISQDQMRVRENMKSLRGTAEERQLLQRYVRQLDEQENRIAALRTELSTLAAEHLKRINELDAFIASIEVR